mmetsp:Transcript_27133/g.68437  ORF Transcript_27133/g.68437 Transcript_27133/m.68437 type:complete len:227 (-) Transcript_27133:187-867(-)
MMSQKFLAGIGTRIFLRLLAAALEPRHLGLFLRRDRWRQRQGHFAVLFGSPVLLFFSRDLRGLGARVGRGLRDGVGLPGKNCFSGSFAQVLPGKLQHGLRRRGLALGRGLGVGSLRLLRRLRRIFRRGLLPVRLSGSTIRVRFGGRIRSLVLRRGLLGLLRRLLCLVFRFLGKAKRASDRTDWIGHAFVSSCSDVHLQGVRQAHQAADHHLRRNLGHLSYAFPLVV